MNAINISQSFLKYCGLQNQRMQQLVKLYRCVVTNYSKYFEIIKAICHIKHDYHTNTVK